MRIRTGKATTMAGLGLSRRTLVAACATALVVALVTGCGIYRPKRAPAEPDNLVLEKRKVEVASVAPLTIAQHVKIETTPADRYVKFRGPQIEASFQPLDWGDGTFYRNVSPKYGGFPRQLLRSWQDKAGGQIRHELYVAYSYSAASAWQFQTAQFDDASVVPLTVFEREVAECLTERCVRVEHFGVPVSDGFLRSRFYTGLQMHVLSPKGHTAVLTVPANYIQGYLTAVDRSARRR
jgi:hypothetical protein